MYHRFVFLTLSVGLLLASPALALETIRLKLEVASGIRQLSQVDSQMLLQDLTGRWHHIGYSGQRLTLSPASPPVLPSIADPDQLPDTAIARGAGTVRQAWFARPTNRYDHGVLGDAIEAGSLKARLANGTIAEFVLPETAVFEDLVPRLADINGDGDAEIIAVMSDISRGAALVLIAAGTGTLKKVAEAEAIGQPHRWLNPVGAADFDGDGRTEIAVVLTPHIGGTLRLYEWQGDRLVTDHQAFGYSNHAMGSRELGLSAVIDVDGNGISDLVLPDSARRALIAVSFQAAEPDVLARVDVQGPFSSGLYVTDLDRDGRPELVFATGSDGLTLLRWVP